MQELLARYPHITAVRMFEEPTGRGFTGKYSIVRDHLRRLRPQPTRPLVERFETGPGQQAQMDYAQYDLDFVRDGRRRVYLFSYILAWSRRQYLCFTENQDFATTIRQHVRAFEYLGGVAATCLDDNMKAVVARYEDDQPRRTPSQKGPQPAPYSEDGPAARGGAGHDPKLARSGHGHGLVDGADAVRRSASDAGGA